MQFSFMKGLISLEAIAREEMNFSNYTFYFK